MNDPKVVPFDREFDGTNMNPEEIMREARRRGWPGIKVDTTEFMTEGVLTVRRMTRRDAYRD